jgi:F-type H+-transporting ATPase subunit delta
VSFDAIAHRYAQAIFELGIETSSLPSLTDEIRLVADAYASSTDMRVLAQSPLVPEAERLAAVDEVAQRLGVSRVTRNVLGVLTEGRRLSALPAIFRNLAKLADERAGVVRATVASAEPLSDEHCRRLQRELEQLTGKKVLLERRQEPDLLAGIVVRIGDRVIDSSARARLHNLRSQLLSA